MKGASWWKARLERRFKSLQGTKHHRDAQCDWLFAMYYGTTDSEAEDDTIAG